MVSLFYLWSTCWNERVITLSNREPNQLFHRLVQWPSPSEGLWACRPLPQLSTQFIRLDQTVNCAAVWSQGSHNTAQWRSGMTRISICRQKQRHSAISSNSSIPCSSSVTAGSHCSIIYLMVIQGQKSALDFPFDALHVALILCSLVFDTQ